ncbi:hypothetical protein PLICRDRAFT_179411 [Plicaturopsis crispa FD-325 SS-3]|uniref:Unplaced genomic scaffold PLICRscaffold_17, whole genome shotgun sequence n=1 Tax=Plicaturopsis crispa FD-325 SS-3 TaxID=944288 RepID=A0A0C9SKZ6_PLICR|nr:hypothetical protein PLICRDRAFT_179411 [Plicaturopsis crispa FD-325 SS-3]
MASELLVEVEPSPTLGDATVSRVSQPLHHDIASHFQSRKRRRILYLNKFSQRQAMRPRQDPLTSVLSSLDGQSSSTSISQLSTTPSPSSSTAAGASSLPSATSSTAGGSPYAPAPSSFDAPSSSASTASSTSQVASTSSTSSSVSPRAESDPSSSASFFSSDNASAGTTARTSSSSFILPTSFSSITLGPTSSSSTTATTSTTPVTSSSVSSSRQSSTLSSTTADPSSTGTPTTSSSSTRSDSSSAPPSSTDTITASSTVSRSTPASTTTSSSSSSSSSDIDITTSTFIPPSSSSSASQSTSTYLTTVIIETSPAGGGAATQITSVSTVIASGTLSPNTQSNSSDFFATHHGAIAGLVLGSLAAVAFVAGWIFMALRRHRKQQTGARGSVKPINFAPDAPWRPPLEDDDRNEEVSRSMSEPYGGLVANRSETGHLTRADEPEATSSGHSGSGFGAYGSGSTENHSPVRNASYGPMTYMPGLGQAAETLAYPVEGQFVYPADGQAYTDEFGVAVDAAGRPEFPRRRTPSGGPDPALWFGGREIPYNQLGNSAPSPTNVESSHGHSTAAHGQDAGYMSTSGSGSSGENSNSSPYGHGASTYPTATSSHDHGLPSTPSDSSTYALRPGQAKRSTSRGENPPSSLRYKGKNKSSDSFKSFVSRLRGGRGSSPESPVKSRGPSPTYPPPMYPARVSPTMTRRPTSPTYPGDRPPPGFLRSHTPPPSSLLNSHSPTTTVFAAHAPPRDIPPENMRKPWERAPLTLPPLPSTSAEDPPEPRSLLDPRLSFRLGAVGQSSSSSLRDHVDYSRPIGGLVNNRMNSTTTFDTKDTKDSLEAQRTPHDVDGDDSD